MRLLSLFGLLAVGSAFCDPEEIFGCTQAKVRANLGRAKRVRAIIGECGHPNLDYDCLTDKLRKCDQTALDIYMTLFDQDQCMASGKSGPCHCGYSKVPKMKKGKPVMKKGKPVYIKNDNALKTAGIVCDAKQNLDAEIHNLPDHCAASEADRITAENGLDLKNFLEEIIPIMNDAEAFIRLVVKKVGGAQMDELVFIDNEQMSWNPYTDHNMFGKFEGDEITERVADEEHNYVFKKGDDYKTWAAAPFAVQPLEFVSLKDEQEAMNADGTPKPILKEDMTPNSEIWESLFVGEHALVTVYRDLDVCNEKNKKCMTYPIGILAAVADNPADTKTTTGIIHYSPYAAAYSCLEEERDIPDDLKKHCSTVVTYTEGQDPKDEEPKPNVQIIKGDIKELKEEI